LIKRKNDEIDYDEIDCPSKTYYWRDEFELLKGNDLSPSHHQILLSFEKTTGRIHFYNWNNELILVS
jgi:hypothetical protein